MCVLTAYELAVPSPSSQAALFRETQGELLELDQYITLQWPLNIQVKGRAKCLSL